jgi:phosphate:Na+ symporter
VEPSKAQEGQPRIEVATDSEGFARAGILLGSQNGSWDVEASISKKDKVRFRVITGVEVDAGTAEGIVGGRVPIRLSLKRSSEGGSPKDLEPLAGRQVLFHLAGAPAGGERTADLRDKRNDTDADGVRETELTLGEKHGVYQVLIEVQGPSKDESKQEPKDEPIPPIVLSIIGMDWLLVGFEMAVGVLIFIFGMRLLGKGFLLLTSPYMYLPTGPWSQKRLQGYFGGVFSGAVFESSSLVSSYLVSFANGGLLTAAGGMALVLGANVGGTLLPQVLGLDLGILAVPFLAAGIALFITPRRSSLVSKAWVFLGAGLVLAAWEILEHGAGLMAMSGQLKAEAASGEVNCALPLTSYAARFFTYFSLAALVAFVFRTSNLVVVLTMLFALNGIVNVPTVVPLVLGANLGAAAMVFTLSVRKRREAKRLALMNLLVQLSGCLGASLLSFVFVQGNPAYLWLIDALVPGRALATQPENLAAHVAAAHTIFNFLSGGCFLLAPRWLLRPLDKLMPAQPADDQVKPYLLDRNLITVPALALRQATEEVIYMTEVCRKTVAEAFDSFRYEDLDLSEQVVRRGEVLSTIHREASQYLVEVAENQLSRLDATQLEILQTTVGSLERIGGLGERLRDMAGRKIEEQLKSAEEVDRELNEVYDLVTAQFGNILSLLRQRDTKTEENTVKTVERIAKFSSRVEAQWRQRIEQGGAQMSPVAVHLQTLIYQEAFGILFRIAAQLAHVAERMRILRPERF